MRWAWETTMSSSTYQEILDRARQELSAEEQLQLVNDLCLRAVGTGKRHSIVELKGLGKHIWQGIDPDEYIREERDSWGG